MYRGKFVVIIAISLSLLLFACKKDQNNITYTNVNQDMILSNEENNFIAKSNEEGSILETKNHGNKENSESETKKDSTGLEDKKINEKGDSVSKGVYQADNKVQNQSGNVNVSNRKYSWSFVRKKDHLPPALEKQQVDLAQKYNAIYLGDTSKKVIYLTFDEGYENGYTSKILDTLKENNVKAAFFITMPYLKNQFDLVDRMVKEGHTVGNHTVNHPSMPEVTDDKKLEQELLELDMLFRERTGTDMKYLRPPKGEYSERTLKISQELGYRNVFWSIAYADWDVNKQKGTEYAHKIVVDNIHNGAVLLLHAVSKDNAEALESIIKALKAQGYTFGTLDDLK